MKTIFVSLLAMMLLITSCKQQLESRLATNLIDSDIMELKGDYLGQTLPDTIPELFASNIISNGLMNRDITFSPEGDEIYYSFTTSDYSYAAVLVSKIVDGIWADPEVATFSVSPEYKTIEPCINYDGSQLFFASDRPTDNLTETDDMNIWVVDKIGQDWGTPQLLDTLINTTLGEFFPSVTKSGDLYFTRDHTSGISYVYRSKFVNGMFAKPERLPSQVNCGRNRFNALISPDESYIIIPALGVEKEVTGVNYYISFRWDDDTWSEPMNMGLAINKNLGRGWSASLSHDGKYLFFMSSRGMNQSSKPKSLSYSFFQELQTAPQNGSSDIYWMKSDFIEKLKAKAKKSK